MSPNRFELCAVDGEEDLGQRSGAAAAEHVHVEAVDDKDECEADRDLGATMSRCYHVGPDAGTLGQRRLRVRLEVTSSLDKANTTLDTDI